MVENYEILTFNEEEAHELSDSEIGSDNNNSHSSVEENFELLFEDGDAQELSDSEIFREEESFSWEIQEDEHFLQEVFSEGDSLLSELQETIENDNKLSRDCRNFFDGNNFFTLKFQSPFKFVTF